MGGRRYVVLALLAPLFGALAAAGAVAPAPTAATGRVPGLHQLARPDTRVQADVSPRAHAAARRSDSSGGRYVGRLHPPATVHLLAARLYWGRRHPTSPTTAAMDHDLGKVSAWYDHVSRGREHVRVTITRWVHVRSSADIMCNTEDGSIRAATAGLRRAGYRPDRYNRLMIFTEQCNSAASAAQLPGRVSWIRFRRPGMATLVHELGHNLGLEHAYGVVCRQDGRRIALGGACFPVEYGDSWDAMGHSTGFFSAPALVRLGWAGTIQDVTTAGTYTVADAEHSGRGNQALKITAGRTTYWVEYQPEHSPQVGRTIPGVMIRREVGRGPVEMIDASPGNPTGIAFPDRDLTNSALPVGSSLTTPQDIRITTVAKGPHEATVRIGFGEPAGAPDAPVDATAVQDADGYLVSWHAPEDNGQIVLGYQVTASPSGLTKFVRSPAGYRTSVRFASTGAPQTFTVEALNQDGWSPPSDTAGPSGPPPVTTGPDVTVTLPAAGTHLTRSFTVSVDASPDAQSGSQPTSAWAEIGSVACSSVDGSGPYTLHCTGAPRGPQTLTVHVENAGGVTTDVQVPVKVHGH